MTAHGSRTFILRPTTTPDCFKSLLFDKWHISRREKKTEVEEEEHLYLKKPYPQSASQPGKSRGSVMCKQILTQATHLPAECTGSLMKDEPQQSTDYSEKSHTPQSDTISPV